MRGIDAQRALLDQTSAAYAHALAITRNRYGAGSAAHADVFLAQTALSTISTASAPCWNTPSRCWRAKTRPPSRLPLWHGGRRCQRCHPPSNPHCFSAGPDIAAAERRVAAANANIGIQRAAYFPQVTLSGSSGLDAASIGNLFLASSSFWSAGLSGVVTLLDFGARKGRVDQARAQFDAAGATYRQTVLTAFQQVEDNLAGLAAYADVGRNRDAASVAADQAENIANNQYLAGSADYSSVIVAQTAAYAARQNRIQSVIDRQTTTVALIQAIGGKWPKAEVAAGEPPIGT